MCTQLTNNYFQNAKLSHGRNVRDFLEQLFDSFDIYFSKTHTTFTCAQL